MKKEELKLYYCTDHDEHWGVGCASIVLAKDVKEATDLLDIELKSHGLKTSEDAPYTLVEVCFEKRAYVLADGNY